MTADIANSGRGSMPGRAGSEASFVRTALLEPQPAPLLSVPPQVWARQHLFASWGGGAATIVTVVALVYATWRLFDFLYLHAVWSGTSRDACLAQTVGHDVGACWPFIKAKLGQLIYGFYTESERWRVNLTFLIGALCIVPLLIPRVPYKIANGVIAFFAFPVAAFFLLVGGVMGLPVVATHEWGGLLVTLVVAFSGIAASLPLGILLALARRSELPIVRLLAVIFIEFWRGVPLVAILFFATYMLPLFLPAQWTLAALLRVIVGVALFASAYMAEVVRGGLQAIPRGQTEGAAALGLGYWRVTGLIVLPQALRLVIPGIVNTFIGLFKDTTLVLIVAIFDFLGQLRAAFADPEWSTPSTLFTGFAFAGLVYFAFCFSMSRYSLFLERRLRTDGRRT
jgi:general L-amino acid transport system permease protein